MTAIFDFALERPGRERLTLDSSGRLRYLVLSAANPERADRVGIFGTTAPEALQDRAVRLADELLGMDPTTRDRGGPVVTVRRGRRSVTHGLDDRYAPAGRLLSELIELVREHPVTVVAGTAEVAKGTDARLVLDNPGTEALELRLDPAGVSVEVFDGARWIGAFAGTAESELFLVDPDGELLGGFGFPAVLEPGATARLHLPGVLSGREVVQRLSITVTGWLELDDPLTRDEDSAGWSGPPAFRLVAGG